MVSAGFEAWLVAGEYTYLLSSGPCKINEASQSVNSSLWLGQGGEKMESVEHWQIEEV